MSHPFVASKAVRLTRIAIAVSKEVELDPSFDGDAGGGQVDAFRHSFWMALLAQNMRWKKAERLGKAHERDNYRRFKKGISESGELPDSVSTAMDLYNNQQGISIGCNNPNLSVEALRDHVKNEVLEGRMKVVLKNREGVPLDCSGRVLLQAELVSWSNKKCLVSSATRRR